MSPSNNVTTKVAPGSAQQAALLASFVIEASRLLGSSPHITEGLTVPLAPLTLGVKHPESLILEGHQKEVMAKAKADYSGVSAKVDDLEKKMVGSLAELVAHTAPNEHEKILETARAFLTIVRKPKTVLGGEFAVPIERILGERALSLINGKQTRTIPLTAREITNLALFASDALPEKASQLIPIIRLNAQSAWERARLLLIEIRNSETPSEQQINELFQLRRSLEPLQNSAQSDLFRRTVLTEIQVRLSRASEYQIRALERLEASIKDRDLSSRVGFAQVLMFVERNGNGARDLNLKSATGSNVPYLVLARNKLRDVINSLPDKTRFREELMAYDETLDSGTSAPLKQIIKEMQLANRGRTVEISQLTGFAVGCGFGILRAPAAPLPTPIKIPQLLSYCGSGAMIGSGLSFIGLSGVGILTGANRIYSSWDTGLSDVSATEALGAGGFLAAQAAFNCFPIVRANALSRKLAPSALARVAGLDTSTQFGAVKTLQHATFVRDTLRTQFKWSAAPLALQAGAVGNKLFFSEATPEERALYIREQLAPNAEAVAVSVATNLTAGLLARNSLNRLDRMTGIRSDLRKALSTRRPSALGQASLTRREASLSGIGKAATSPLGPSLANTVPTAFVLLPDQAAAILNPMIVTVGNAVGPALSSLAKQFGEPAIHAAIKTQVVSLAASGSPELAIAMDNVAQYSGRFHDVLQRDLEYQDACVKGLEVQAVRKDADYKRIVDLAQRVREPERRRSAVRHLAEFIERQLSVYRHEDPKIWSSMLKLMGPKALQSILTHCIEANPTSSVVLSNCSDVALLIHNSGVQLSQELRARIGNGFLATNGPYFYRTWASNHPGLFVADPAFATNSQLRGFQNHLTDALNNMGKLEGDGTPTSLSNGLNFDRPLRYNPEITGVVARVPADAEFDSALRCAAQALGRALLGPTGKQVAVGELIPESLIRLAHAGTADPDVRSTVFSAVGDYLGAAKRWEELDRLFEAAYETRTQDGKVSVSKPFSADKRTAWMHSAANEHAFSNQDVLDRILFKAGLSQREFLNQPFVVGRLVDCVRAFFDTNGFSMTNYPAVVINQGLNKLLAQQLKLLNAVPKDQLNLLNDKNRAELKRRLRSLSPDSEFASTAKSILAKL